MARRAQLTTVVTVAALVGCGGGQRDSTAAAEATLPGADGLITRNAARLVPGTTDRVPRQVTQTCRRAATKAEIEVLCPKIVPRGRIERSLGFGPMIPSGERRFYELTFNNASGRHWVVGRGGRREVAEFVNRSQARARLIRRERVDGRVMSAYAFEDYPVGGLHGDHVAIFTNYRGTVHYASVHGDKYRVALSVLRSMLPTP